MDDSPEKILPPMRFELETPDPRAQRSTTALPSFLIIYYYLVALLPLKIQNRHLKMNSDMGDMLNNSCSDNPCNEMLLAAVRKKNIKEVQRLVEERGIHLNYDLGDGGTILFESLFVKNYPIFIHLLNAGYDCNISNNMKETPLHIAVTYSPSNFVHELIKRGADITCQDQSKHTPLHNAGFHGNVEAACILLYYGADVNARCNENMTPLMWALEENEVEVAKVLFNFYDDFSCTSIDGSTALTFAVTNENPLAVDILNSDVGENEDADTLLLYSLEHENAEVFKLIWSKFNKEISVNNTFLMFYLCKCKFSNSEWLECLQLLMKSPTVFEHLLQCRSSCVIELQRCKAMMNLLLAFYKRQIKVTDRLPILYLFLSFGIEISIEDINLVYSLYGFNQELEIFIYTFNYERIIPVGDLLVLPRLIFALEDNPPTDVIPQIFKYICNVEILAILGDRRLNIILEAFGFFSLTVHQKLDIIHLCQDNFQDYNRIQEKLDVIPEVPSLLELCRNQTWQLIRQIYNVEKLYRFHDIIKNLILPQSIKDIICLKTPIY